eukprot:CAMPEP_0202947592 /NCGR_PEP_ID=MMETSP1395-20130829/11740_1 /ASSEMBLY_ACC=CAM_ASM_000871 /TAXON_ID=5961 /ORGANISM="Blepharisma japonicum, Strain Stock R1072" /LENGTH=149 /DNA_ID=CAMNT_0049648969 /DNA_START=12 /DNA_END=462 /DNA_ORIENTATION=-
MPNFLYGSGNLQEISKSVEEEIKVAPAPIQSQANPTNLQAGKEAFKNFAIYLSKFALENNIQIGQKGKEILLSRIKQLDRTEAIPIEILQLVHNIAEHRSKPKYYKLNVAKKTTAENASEIFFLTRKDANMASKPLKEKNPTFLDGSLN